MIFGYNLRKLNIERARAVQKKVVKILMAVKKVPRQAIISSPMIPLMRPTFLIQFEIDHNDLMGNLLQLNRFVKLLKYYTLFLPAYAPPRRRKYKLDYYFCLVPVRFIL